MGSVPFIPVNDPKRPKTANELIFGEFLDHYPYFGMQSEQEAQELKDAYGDTLEIYEREFGTPPDGTWISADAARCVRKNCKPQKCK